MMPERRSCWCSSWEVSEQAQRSVLWCITCNEGKRVAGPSLHGTTHTDLRGLIRGVLCDWSDNCYQKHNLLSLLVPLIEGQAMPPLASVKTTHRSVDGLVQVKEQEQGMQQGQEPPSQSGSGGGRGAGETGATSHLAEDEQPPAEATEPRAPHRLHVRGGAHHHGGGDAGATGLEGEEAATKTPDCQQHQHQQGHQHQHQRQESPLQHRNTTAVAEEWFPKQDGGGGLGEVYY